MADDLSDLSGDESVSSSELSSSGASSADGRQFLESPGPPQDRPSRRGSQTDIADKPKPMSPTSAAVHALNVANDPELFAPGPKVANPVPAAHSGARTPPPAPPRRRTTMLRGSPNPPVREMPAAATRESSNREAKASTKSAKPDRRSTSSATASRSNTGDASVIATSDRSLGPPKQPANQPPKAPAAAPALVAALPSSSSSVSCAQTPQPAASTRRGSKTGTDRQIQPRRTSYGATPAPRPTKSLANMARPPTLPKQTSTATPVATASAGSSASALAVGGLGPSAIELLNAAGFAADGTQLPPPPSSAPSSGASSPASGVSIGSAISEPYFPYTHDTVVAVALASSGQIERLCAQLVALGGTCRRLKQQNRLLHGVTKTVRKASQARHRKTVLALKDSEQERQAALKEAAELRRRVGRAEEEARAARTEAFKAHSSAVAAADAARAAGVSIEAPPLPTFEFMAVPGSEADGYQDSGPSSANWGDDDNQSLCAEDQGHEHDEHTRDNRAIISSSARNHHDCDDVSGIGVDAAHAVSSPNSSSPPYSSVEGSWVDDDASRALLESARAAITQSASHRGATSPAQTTNATGESVTIAASQSAWASHNMSDTEAIDREIQQQLEEAALEATGVQHPGIGLAQFESKSAIHASSNDTTTGTDRQQHKHEPSIESDGRTAAKPTRDVSTIRTGSQRQRSVSRHANHRQHTDNTTLSAGVPISFGALATLISPSSPDQPSSGMPQDRRASRIAKLPAAVPAMHSSEQDRGIPEQPRRLRSVSPRQRPLADGPSIAQRAAQLMADASSASKQLSKAYASSGTSDERNRRPSSMSPRTQQSIQRFLRKSPSKATPERKQPAVVSPSPGQDMSLHTASRSSRHNHDSPGGSGGRNGTGTAAGPHPSTAAQPLPHSARRRRRRSVSPRLGQGPIEFPVRSASGKADTKALRPGHQARRPRQTRQNRQPIPPVTATRAAPNGTGLKLIEAVLGKDETNESRRRSSSIEALDADLIARAKASMAAEGIQETASHTAVLSGRALVPRAAGHPGHIDVRERMRDATTAGTEPQDSGRNSGRSGGIQSSRGIRSARGGGKASQPGGMGGDMMARRTYQPYKGKVDKAPSAVASAVARRLMRAKTPGRAPKHSSTITKEADVTATATGKQIGRGPQPRGESRAERGNSRGRTEAATTVPSVGPLEVLGMPPPPTLAAFTAASGSGV